MKDGNKPIVNPFVVLREEFDDWAILFDSDTCRGFGLNPTDVFVWKLLDGEHSVSDLLAELSGQYLDVINTAPEELEEFIQELASYGLAGCGLQAAHDGKSGTTPPGSYVSGDADGGRCGRVLHYTKPRLEVFTSNIRALGNCSHGSGAQNGSCVTGHLAACSQGARVETPCNTGTNAAACSNGNSYTAPSCGMGTAG